MEIRESNQFHDKIVVDEEAAVVRNVRVIGEISKNKLVFPFETRKAAFPLLENAWVNWNHTPREKPNADVPLETRFGYLTNIRDEDGTRGDLHYFRDHQFAKHFVSMAKQNPRACGLSIRGEAKGKGKDAQGRTIVDQLLAVKSVDLVADPANTFGLHESTEAPPEAPVAEGEESTSTDYTAEGCIKAIEQVMAGEGDARAKLAAMEEHLSQLKELEGDDEDGDGEGKEKNVDESAKVKARADCIQLCESLNVKDPDGTFIDMLVHVPVDHRQALVKKYKVTSLARKTKSGSPTIPVCEAAVETGQKAETLDERLERIAAQMS